MAPVSLAERLLRAARDRGVLIATAESCTAGMVAAAITDPPGASAIFDRGFVTYTNAAKIDLLGVSEHTLAAFGAVSEEVVREMATGALARSDAHLAVAVSGVAGPGGSETKPEGRVCFALASRGAPATSETIEFGALGRDRVRRASTEKALALLLEAVRKQPAI